MPGGQYTYLEALACATGSSSLLEEAAQVCRPVIHNGKRYRGLNALVQKDHALLLAVSRGEFILSGIRNADLRASLYQPSEATKLTKAEIRRRSAVVTRQFARSFLDATSAVEFEPPLVLKPRACASKESQGDRESERENHDQKLAAFFSRASARSAHGVTLNDPD